MASKATPKRISPNRLVEVKNGFNGRLIFENKRTGEIYEWNEFGESQDITFTDLKYAKASQKDFFINNWFLIEDEDVIEALGLNKYYDNALSEEEFDALFKLSPSEITARINELSDGQKKSLGYKAKALYKEEKIDSLKVITALEHSLGITLRDI